MNTISNNKLLLLTAVGTLMINGCVTHKKIQQSSFVQPKKVIKKSKTWKTIKQKRDDCPDCYAFDISSKKKSLQLRNFEPKEECIVSDSSKTAVNVIDTYIKAKPIKITPKPRYFNSSRDTFNTKLTSDTTIQVGAFRHYLGAKKRANKYRLLSNKYNVKIETGTKDGLPIHRVRISGFHSKGQAKAFMRRYAISDAFLVRR